MKYKCIIVDDEQPARKLLENYCSKLSELEHVGSFKSALDAAPILREQSIDILFLDIQMPNISGIDFLKTLKNLTTKVVLTTAYRDYAVEGYDLDAIDYLLKPIEFHRFLRAIDKIKDVYPKSNNLQIQETSPDLIIKSNKKLYKISPSDILYIKSENEYIKYNTLNHGNLMVHGALKDISNMLKKHGNFIRIHRSYVINMIHISYIEGNRIAIGQQFFPVSETYKNDFLKAWKN